MKRSVEPSPPAKTITVGGIKITWDLASGTCSFENLPVAMMWVDTTLAGMMSGVQAMVGTERFLLALQSEGRKSVEADWQVMSAYPDFASGFKAIGVIAAVAGWGEWVLVSRDDKKKECGFHVTHNWEGRYQKSLGVSWGSAMLAGKFAGYCSKLYKTNCWADQTMFITRGDAYDEFIVKPSTRSIEREIGALLATDKATRADMAAALRKLEQEIAERRKSEEALRESEEKFRTLVEATTDWIWEVDADGVYTYSSPRVFDLLGYSHEAVIGKRPIDFMRDEERERLLSKISILFTKKEPFFNLINENISIDGRAVILETSGLPRVDSSGNFLGFRGIDRDITERVQAENAMREKDSFIKALLDTSQDWIWAIDLNGVHTYSNPAVRSILGFNAEEIVGKSASQLIFEEDRELVNETLRRCIRERCGWNGLLIRWRHRDGGCRYLESNSVPILDQAGTIVGFRGVDRDITARKKAEEERLDMERRLLHGQKLESLGVLAGGIAHDFNNLLMAIMGNLELALVNIPVEAAIREYIEQAFIATQRAADLTREMLAYSGKGRFIVTCIDLNELVRQNAGLFRTAISRQVALDLSLSVEQVHIEADSGQVQQVIMNLITNASEAIGASPGLIRVTTESREYTAEELSGSRLEGKPSPGHFACIQVTDTGAGMDEEIQRKLFEPFFTTKFTGRGLGMSAVLGIVGGHKGAIMVKSAPGAGTTIRVLFPYCTPETIQAASTQQETLTMPSLRIVLVVEDEESIRQLCLEYIGRLGFRGIGAQDGEEALLLLEKYRGEIDLVLLDLTMPGMDGVVTFQRMKRIRPDIMVVLTSGYNEQDAVRRFTGEGLAGFIQKPYRLEELKAKIEKLGPGAGKS